MIGRSSGEAAYSVKWLGRSPSFNISSEWKTPPLVSMSNAKQFLHKPLWRYPIKKSNDWYEGKGEDWRGLESTG